MACSGWLSESGLFIHRIYTAISPAILTWSLACTVARFCISRVVVWLAIILALSSATLALWEAVYEVCTALAVIAAVVLFLMNAPSPDIVYKSF